MKKISLVQIKADMGGIKEVSCERCETTSLDTKNWYYVTTSGQTFCPDCGEDLQYILEEAKEAAINKFVAK